MINSLIGATSHFFAENKSLSLLLLVSIAVFGIASFAAMPKQYNPEIVRPAFVISLSYAGATTNEAIDRVGYELIENLQVVPGVEDIYTRVTDGAVIMTTVMFEVGYDKAQAKVDLLSQLDSHHYLASGAVSNVSVQEINPETIPVLQIVFSSSERTVGEVREAVLALRPTLLNVTGVSELQVVGTEDRSIMVSLEPVKLASLGVTLSEVKAALASASVRVRAGDLEGETYAISTTLDAQVKNISEIEQLPLRDGVVLRDVATVYEGVSPDHSYTLYADTDVPPTEVVMLAVAKREGSSAPVVTKAVLSVINTALQQGVYSDLTYTVVSDDGEVAETEISNLVSNLITSIIIVGLVLLLFLSTRAALVVLITVPLTFLSVLGVGLIAGESMNRITLFALILSLGLLVDASIVVVDNIYEHLRRAHAQGRTSSLPKIAAGAMEEVGVGLVLSAVTSVVVFLPMFYITGMMGPYMQPIAFFVPVALMASLLIAIVLTPFLAIKILNPDEKETALSAMFQRGLATLTHTYVTLLKRIAYEPVFRKWLLLIVSGVFLMTLILPLTGLVHFQMLPKADRNQFYLYLDAPEGTSREAMKELSDRVTSAVLTHEAVKTTQSFVSGSPVVDFNGLFKGAPMRTEKNEATIRVNLVSTSERDKSSTETAVEIRHVLKEILGADADFVRLMEEPPGPPVAATFEAKVSAESTEVRRDVSEKLFGHIGGIEGVTDRYISTEALVEELVYTIDRTKVGMAGVSAQDVLTWYSLLTAPQVAGEFLHASSSERVPMYLDLPAVYRESPAAVNQIPVLRGDGFTTALAGLFTTTYVLRPGTEYLEVARPVEYVTAEVEGRSIVYVMIELLRNVIGGELSGYEVVDWDLFGLTLEAENGETASIVWGGEWEMTLENFRDLGIAMLVALFLVYAVLVAQYGSFSVPGLILVTIPLGLIGIFTGFLILDMGFGIYLTATALIGFIALIGIVVNNAIIYLEYVDQATAEGTSYPDALIAAGAARLRPILSTSLTTVLGSLTIASDPVWSGLAWSFIFGLSLSTILTLIVFPALLLQFRSSK
jgi:multidrug efflux pump subunit AcrB